MGLFIVQKNTKSYIQLGPFVDITDVTARLTSLTVASTSVKLSKESVTTLTAKTDPTALEHIGNGYYKCTLGVDDVDTNGHLKVVVDESSAFPVDADVLVVSANVFSSLVLDTDKLQVDVTQMGGSSASWTLLQNYILASEVETGLNLQNALRGIFSASAGKASRSASTYTLRNYADTKNRIVATVDANGNRSAITYDFS